MERKQSFGEKIIRPKMLPQTMQRIEQRFGKDTAIKLQKRHLDYDAPRCFDRFEKHISDYTSVVIAETQQLQNEGVKVKEELVMIFPGMGLYNSARTHFSEKS